jgi:hypothetical protein
MTPTEPFDIQQRLREMLAPISEASQLVTDYIAIVSDLTAEGPSARSRAVRELRVIRRRVDSCLRRCKTKLPAKSCAELETISEQIVALFRDLGVGSSRGRR